MIIQPAERTNTVTEYYFASKLREIEELKRQGKKVLNLGIGSPDMMPHDDVLDEMASQSKKQGSNGYQSYTGLPALREAFAGWYKRYFGIELDPGGEILPLMGSKEGIMHISMAFLNPGDGVLIPNPGYPAYAAVTRLVGAMPVEYNLKPENGWLPDFEEIENMDLTGVKLMWVNYPNMPSGAKANLEFFNQLIHFAKQKKILICNDNPYSFILNDNPLSIFSAEGAKEVALELNSMSKSHNMAGFRMGMVSGQADYLKNILTVKSNMDSGMYKPIQLAAIKALQSPPEWYSMINAEYAKRRNLAGKLFDTMAVDYDSEQTGMFLWGLIPEGFADGYDCSDHLLYKHNVFITPGGIFGSNGNQFIRVSLCSKPEVFEEVIERVIGSFNN
ncbi:MAG: aminotransferase class I/II-fold pyridoxal phosphate-dependent enzyme [Bacteroidales bacterium]|nr:aminotransferase class I/II-fold pyridoxal phosphate-dependent enzyme [Bacteroidales bacterium]